MKNTKLIQMLKSFSKEEFTEFEKFIASPFHNHGRDYKTFVKALKKFYPLFDSENLTYEYVFKKAYPEKHFNKTFLNNAISRVFKMSEEYLQYKVFQKSERERMILYLNELIGRNLDKIYLYNSKMAEEKMFNFRNIDREYFYWLSRFEDTKKYYKNANSLRFDGIVNQKRQDEYLFKFFLVKFSMSFHSEISLREQFNTDCYFVENILSGINFKFILENISDKQEPDIIKIYYSLIMMLKERKNIEHQKKYRYCLQKYINRFNSNEAFWLYITLMTSIMGSAQILDVNVIKEYFSVFEEMLDKDIVSSLDGKPLGVISYINYITTASILNKTDRMEKFIDKYTNLLKPEQRENMINFALGYLNFTKCNFKEAIKYFTLFKPFEYGTDIECRKIILKSCYELDEYESSVYYIDNYKHFLNKCKGMPEENKLEFMNFINNYSRLFKLKRNPDKNEINLFLAEIDNSKIRRPIWLKKKLNEMILQNGKVTDGTEMRDTIGKHSLRV